MEQIIKKLQIKSNMKGKILNLPPMLEEQFKNWPEQLLTDAEADLDYVLVFVEKEEDVQKFAPMAVSMIREDGLLLFGYPKKSGSIKTDISRDHGWDKLSELGYRPVRLISLDSNWSVFRFREKSRVNKKS